MSIIADYIFHFSPYTKAKELSAMIEFNNAAIGLVIRRIRNQKKLSQEVLSGFAGLARSHLAMIENGDKKPNFETIWRIANALDMLPHELVKLIEDQIRGMS